jgi:hypothetical protein
VKVWASPVNRAPQLHHALPDQGGPYLLVFSQNHHLRGVAEAACLCCPSQPPPGAPARSAIPGEGQRCDLPSAKPTGASSSCMRPVALLGLLIM